MDLNNVTVEMRPRSEWEAVDFGARMVRRDAAAIYRIWFAITLPLLLLSVAVVIFTPYGTLALFLYWWFEPLADGPILRIISRRLFGEDADVRSALRATPRLLLRNLIFLLPPYRFHMARSTAMPVTQLEGLRGDARRARAKVLNIRISNYGMGVTLAYHHLVLALYLGVFLIIFALIPTAYQDSLGMDWLNIPLQSSDRWAVLMSLCIFYVAQSALQPWFVGAGFGLYINCRTQLEAWDIEVAFRRLVQRRAAGVVAGLAIACLLPLAMLPDNAVAQGDVETPMPAREDSGFVGYWNDDDARSAVNAALANDALRQYQETEVWKPINAKDDEVNASRSSSNAFQNALIGIGKFFSYLIEFGLWILLAALLCLIFVTRGRWLPYIGFGLPKPQKTRRIVLSGGEVTAESLPADIPGEVARLWRANQTRDALSLLYRGSVFRAVAKYGVRLPESATEGLCLAAVTDQADSEQSDYFARVVKAWILCAYGFRNPDESTVLSMCTEWPKHFGGPQ
ncbi:MAG TPA: hypothetical protein PKH39_05785 [Woeseiaceae bacterium]|nr:hypothetical protein [Woeseiaceae bacterium]